MAPMGTLRQGQSALSSPTYAIHNQLGFLIRIKYNELE